MRKKHFRSQNQYWDFLKIGKILIMESTENKDEYELTEQVAIALAVSLDIFGQNSLEANADVLDIK